MIFVHGGRHRLGEPDPDPQARWYPNQVLLRRDVELPPFCMDRFPFPGGPGAPWPRDGLRLEDLPAVEAELAAHGRRLCQPWELVLAQAGPGNARYPTSQGQPSAQACDPRDAAPQPTGTLAECRSTLGFHDFATRSTWSRLDETVRAALTEQGAQHQPGADGDYGVVGGLARDDTYYAPSNFGIHFHVPGQERWADDGLRACAEPGAVDPARETAWNARLAAFRADPRFEAWLGEPPAP
jgi:hypothetical protein